jgi:hypothetical protein
MVLENATRRISRLEALESYRKSAQSMAPERSYTFAIIGAILVVAGVFLYIK